MAHKEGLLNRMIGFEVTTIGETLEDSMNLVVQRVVLTGAIDKKRERGPVGLEVS